MRPRIPTVSVPTSPAAQIGFTVRGRIGSVLLNAHEDQIRMLVAAKLHADNLARPFPPWADHTAAHKRPRSSFTRFEAQVPNEMWQADTTHCPLAEGIDVEIQNVTDDHSRLLLASAALRTVTAESQSP